MLGGFVAKRSRSGKRVDHRTPTDEPEPPSKQVAHRATLPPSQGEIPPTEDTLPKAAPVCDRGTLTMVSGAEAGIVFRLGAQTYIGRALECDIRVEDVGVSRRHAVVTQEADTAYVVQDLGSRNGTTVRGRPATREYLADGDRVGIGPIQFRFALADETEEEALRRRYESSIIDGLTGALNRTHFHDRLIGELAFAKRHQCEVSLLFLDIDHFKEVNDSFGHVVGDAALKHFTATVHKALRTEDVFARYGGEEFAIIARGIDRDHAMAFAERIRKLVEGAQLVVDDVKIPLTVSIGVASLADCRDASLDQLMELSDKRLYLAKAAGRNCCRGA
jgi:diguanylate cyclase (GGDEF)-like protein